MNEIICLSATALARAIRSKDISALNVVTAYLERIETINPTINAVVQLAADRALDEARAADAALAHGEVNGPLHGVPMTLKDSIDTAGIVTTAGTTGRRNFIPEKDATVAARLREAGAILLGKTNTPELTLYVETVNLVYGRTRNPYNPDRSPGGSSGGAAAIVAACGSPFDLGSDTGGSIRQPAHFCGIAGLKPTSGRVPRTGHIISYEMGALDSLTTIGPLTRYVEDLALIFPIIAGVDWHDPAIVPMPIDDPGMVELSTLRGAYYTDNEFVPPTAEVAATVKSAVSALSNAGMALEENRPDEVKTGTGMWLKLATADGGDWVRRILEAAGTKEIDPILKNRILSRNPISSSGFTSLLTELDRLRSGMLRFMKQYDVIVCPVNAFPAMPHGEVMAKGDGYSYTRTYNLTGWPVVVVRCGTSSDGMPIGVQVVARPWREDVALAVAAHLEKACGGWQPPPL